MLSRKRQKQSEKENRAHYHCINFTHFFDYTSRQKGKYSTNRADFFDLKQEDGETAADVWKRILEIEKNCEFETKTAAELLASKSLSVIGKSNGDYDQKKKIRKSDMSVEAKTDAIIEYTYYKLNDSLETEEEKKIRYLNKRKIKPIKERPENRQNSKKLTATVAGHQTGHDNTNAHPEEKNVQNVERQATLPNVAAQVKK